MAVIANAAYFGTTGKFEIVSDEYTAAVTSCALVPNAPSARTQDIGGGVTSFIGANQWTAELTYNQDWKTTNSLSQYLITNHGTTKVCKYTPDNGGKVVTFTALIQAGQIGGAAATVHSASVSLQVNGNITLSV